MKQKIEYEKKEENGKILLYNKTMKSCVGEVFQNCVYSLDGTTCYGLDPTINHYDSPEIENLLIKPGVKEIDNFAFSAGTTYIEIKNVHLPPSVEKIGKKAFYGSNIESINLENVLFFGTAAFKETKLEVVEINKNAKFENNGSENGLFQHCDNLRAVIFHPEEVPDGMCCDCTNLDILVLQNVRDIGDMAFKNCKALTHFDAPDTLKTVGCAAFANSGLVDFHAGPMLDRIGVNAFYRCENLQTVTFEENETKGERLDLLKGCFQESAIKEIILPTRTTGIQTAAFKNCNELRSLIIKGPVLTLHSEMASGCEKLSTVELHPETWYIENNCFYKTNLARVDEQFKNIHYFGSCCFKYCDNLMFVHTYEDADIAKECFASCDKLDIAVIEGNKVVSSAFMDSNKNMTLIAPNLEDKKQTFKKTHDSNKEIKNQKISSENIKDLLDYMSFKEIMKLPVKEGIIETVPTTEPAK